MSHSGQLSIWNQKTLVQNEYHIYIYIYIYIYENKEEGFDMAREHDQK